jgi:DNA invertase Pin-like site-specific DNA recombinase
VTARRRFVAYFRVSTQQQGRSGLGLAAQQEAVQKHVASVPASWWTPSRKSRLVSSTPVLRSPRLAACRAMHATLIIAKLDRLARNAAFLLSVVEGSGQGGVVFCDLPQVPPGPSGKFVIAIMAAVAELEAGLISERTKAALAQAKARGVRLGIRGSSQARASRPCRRPRRNSDTLPIGQHRCGGPTSRRHARLALRPWRS